MYMLKRNENISLHKNFYKNICRSVIHNSQKVEINQTFNNGWTDKQNAVYQYIRTLFGHKRKWSTDAYYDMDETWKHIMVSQRSKSQKTTYYMIPVI